MVLPATAQVTGYGVTDAGSLFRFDPAAPAVVTPIGNLGFVPEGIDFRPGTQTLYAIDVGPNTTQLYTVNTSTAAATPVGAGFASNGTGYTLTGNNRFGFDFNPTTLQGDGSVRIRLVSDNTAANLRLNSDTGAIAATDTPLAIGTDAPFVSGVAYTNSAASTAGGTTTLYDMDARTDALYIQNPPNNGVLNLVGPFGVTIDANPGISFDIVSTNPADTTLADELAFAVFTRTATSGGAYLLYDVNLTTGQTLNGRLVGGGMDFTGGLALIVPEPGSISAATLAAAALMRRNRRV
jgi:hypothetical protein